MGDWPNLGQLGDSADAWLGNRIRIADGYVRLPGIAGDRMETETIDAYAVTDLDVAIECALDDWTPSAERTLFAKWITSGNQESWALTLQTTGALRIYWTGNGSTNRSLTSSASVTATDGERLWVRCQLDVVRDATITNVAGSGTTVTYTAANSFAAGQIVTITGVDPVAYNLTDAVIATANATSFTVTNAATGAYVSGGVASQHAARFFQSANGIDFTEIGVTATAGITAGNTIFQSTAPVTIGQNGGDGFGAASGDYYRAVLRDSINGNVILDIDCANATTIEDGFLADTGQLVTFVATGVSTNDPKFLDWAGSNYIYQTGEANNYLSVPDAANLDITGDIDLRARVALDDWTPASANRRLISKYGAAGNRSYLFDVTTAGILRFTWSADGTAVTSVSSTVVHGLTDGSESWVRVTFDVDNGASGNDTRFFTSTDGVTWTQLGATVTTAGAATMFNSTATLAIGAESTGTNSIAGKVYRAQVLNGIAGTVVLDVDTSRVASGGATSFLAATGQTVTIFRATSGRKTVAVTAPCYLLGTDDYASVIDQDSLDFDATESFTAMVAVRRWNNPISEGLLYKKQTLSASADAGWGIAGTTASTATAWLSDTLISGSVTSPPSVTSGAVSVVFLVVNRSTGVAYTSLDGVMSGSFSLSGWGSFANAQDLVIGSISGLGSYAECELLSVAVWPRAVAATDLATVTAEVKARWV